MALVVVGVISVSICASTYRATKTFTDRNAIIIRVTPINRNNRETCAASRRETTSRIDRGLLGAPRNRYKRKRRGCSKPQSILTVRDLGLIDAVTADNRHRVCDAEPCGILNCFVGSHTPATSSIRRPRRRGLRRITDMTSAGSSLGPSSVGNPIDRTT